MTRLESSTLRYLAIVSIMLHNFAHWLPGAAPENEFSFSLENYYSFWNSLFGKDFLIQLFSFFGHLGVPVFVFLTGYGLSRKYDKIELDWKSFLYNHWKKLFVPLVVGTLVYLIVMFILKGQLVCSVFRIITQFTLCLNLISPMHLLPMPYWYLGMTMQLYVLYLLLVHKRQLTVLLHLTIISLIIMACFINFPKALIVSKLNSIGWFVPFCMGIAHSRYHFFPLFKRKVFMIGGLGMSIVLVFICGFNYYAWLLIPFVIIILAVGVVKYIPVFLQQKMVFIGSNSLYFLIVHPITRELIIPLVPYMGGYTCLLIYLLINYFAVYVFLDIKNKLYSVYAVKDNKES